MELIEMKYLKYRYKFLRWRFMGKYRYSTLDRRYYITFYNDEVDDINGLDDAAFNLYFELQKKESKYYQCTIPNEEERYDIERFWDEHKRRYDRGEL